MRVDQSRVWSGQIWTLVRQALRSGRYAYVWICQSLTGNMSLTHWSLHETTSKHHHTAKPSIFPLV